MLTIDELLDAFRESIQESLDISGLNSWSVEAAGENFNDPLDRLPTEDLEDLINEIQEGLSLKVEIDFSDAILAVLQSLLEDRALEDDEDDFHDFDEDDY